jgi:hypothetical protein
MLDNGTFEPAVIKQNTYLVVGIKLFFLTFFGAFFMIIVELASTMMCATQLLAMMTSGMDGFDKVKKAYMYFFEKVLKINEERQEGLKQQRSIAQLCFENIPMLIL